MNWSKDPRTALLRELVAINSGTTNIAGVNRVQDIVAREAKTTGLSVRFETNADGAEKSGKFLVAETGAAGLRTIDLVTHADTVFETSSGFLDFTLDEKAGRARGPGVIDDKGGIVVALEGLKRWLAKTPSGERRIRVRLLCAPSEEVGSPGFHDLLARLGREAWMALGFEPAFEDGSIVKSRRGNRWYTIRVQGRAAHSGRYFSQGVNAAHELAFKLVELHGLTDLKRNLTVSTSTLCGGDGKFNIVCAEAEARIDVRFADFETRDQVHRKVEKIIADPHLAPAEDGARPTGSYSLADDCPPFAFTPGAATYVDRYIGIVENIERRKIEALKSGGAADVNYMSHPGLIVIDGLGPFGGGMHRTDEFIELSSLETRSEALAQLLTEINRDT